VPLFKPAALLPTINSTQRKRPLERLSNYSETRYRSLRVISRRSRRGFIDVLRVKRHEVQRCCSPISRAAFNALTGARTQGPRAKRFPKGFLRISATGNTIIATPIPEMAEYGSRSARHWHALDLAAQTKDHVSAPDCTTRLRSARKQPIFAKARSATTVPRFRDARSVWQEDSPRSVY
jgi:hypothetical protein